MEQDGLGTLMGLQQVLTGAQLITVPSLPTADTRSRAGILGSHNSRLPPARGMAMCISCFYLWKVDLFFHSRSHDLVLQQTAHFYPLMKLLILSVVHRCFYSPRHRAIFETLL